MCVSVESDGCLSVLGSEGSAPMLGLRGVCAPMGSKGFVCLCWV